MRRTPEQFREAAHARQITEWPSHPCTFCRYVVGYQFDLAADHVYYDNGCWCGAGQNLRESSWDAVAERYNMQTHPEVIAAMDTFWGFAPSVEEAHD